MVRLLGIVSFRIFPTHMGGQKGVADFYRHLSGRADVLLAASNDNKDSGRLELHRLLHPNRRIYLNIFKLHAIKKLAMERHVEILVAEHSYTGWIAWLLRRATGLPFVIHSHNIESKRFRHMKKWWWPAYQAYEGWVHRRADHSFFISAEDRDHALQHFRLVSQRCSVITYGVGERNITGDRKALRRTLGLPEDKAIWLFNGTLDYQPNYDAVVTLVQTIEPLLRRRSSQYQIVITGNRAPRTLIELMQSNDYIHYAGYVPDVDLYYQAADLFINPVAHDTGVKTKLIEALANGCPAVSTTAGAAGLRREVCGGQLTVVPDGGWTDFVEKIVEHRPGPRETPPAFYEVYGWSGITATAAAIFEDLRAKHTARP